MMIGSPDVTLKALWTELTASPIDLDDPGLGRYLIASMGSLPQETLGILCLDDRRNLLAEAHLPSGSPCQGVIHPRAIFRRALEHDAVALILIHNHPSGSPDPSENDIRATRRLADLGRSLDIEIIDHIVVTATSVRSVAAVDPVKTDPVTSASHVLRDSFGRGDEEQLERRLFALENARRIYQRRLYRRELIGSPKLFGEPAWEILIDLYIHSSQGKRIATSALCMGSSAPPTTALRRVNELCEAGIAVKIDDPDDGRRQFVELTPDTAKRLEAYFSGEDW